MLLTHWSFLNLTTLKREMSVIKRMKKRLSWQIMITNLHLPFRWAWLATTKKSRTRSPFLSIILADCGPAALCKVNSQVAQSLRPATIWLIHDLDQTRRGSSHFWVESSLAGQVWLTCLSVIVMCHRPKMPYQVGSYGQQWHVMTFLTIFHSFLNFIVDLRCLIVSPFRPSNFWVNLDR